MRSTGGYLPNSPHARTHAPSFCPAVGSSDPELLLLLSLAVALVLFVDVGSDAVGADVAGCFVGVDAPPPEPLLPPGAAVGRFVGGSGEDAHTGVHVGSGAVVHWGAAVCAGEGDGGDSVTTGSGGGLCVGDGLGTGDGVAVGGGVDVGVGVGDSVVGVGDSGSGDSGSGDTVAVSSVGVGASGSTAAFASETVPGHAKMASYAAWRLSPSALIEQLGSERLRTADASDEHAALAHTRAVCCAESGGRSCTPVALSHALVRVSTNW